MHGVVGETAADLGMDLGGRQGVIGGPEGGEDFALQLAGAAPFRSAVGACASHARHLTARRGAATGPDSACRFRTATLSGVG
ncbi:hypothetical protein GCM10011579_090360 [Streptomyces albiflavescens]|uniref:Uncharacterized protein n=1 Tax=Streptomyces albiflavescens TaxID=1623582 RepID=A0A917YEC1_9ACTN|nr:hypothetical protein GCM10011579_090360 [Streptomyces albiflavescens]